MSFHEKSAWIMSIILIAFGAIYFNTVYAMSSSAGFLVDPFPSLLIKYTVAMVIIIAVGHAVIAIMSPKDANAQPDE
jgi:hypothetical protein